MINSGLNGLYINEYLNDNVDNWDLSFSKNHANEQKELSFAKELIENYQVYSSRMLMNNERVICYRLGLSAVQERRPTYSSDNAVTFVKYGMIDFTNQITRFYEKCNEYIKVLKK